MYYIVNFCAFIIERQDLSSFDAYTILLTISGTNAWTFIPTIDIIPFIPPCIPSWTISTLSAFYLLFPIILPLLQQISSQTLGLLLTLLFHLQCWPILLTR